LNESQNKSLSRYFLNHLLFGSLSSSLVQTICNVQNRPSSSVSMPEQNKFNSESLFFGFDSHSFTNDKMKNNNNNVSNYFEKQINVEVEDEANLQDIFIDLGEIENKELTFSHAALSFLKLNYEFDTKTLNIVVNIVRRIFFHFYSRIINYLIS
jgi:hypothetical protein